MNCRLRVRQRGKGKSTKYCPSAARLSARPLPLRVLGAAVSGFSHRKRAAVVPYSMIGYVANLASTTSAFRPLSPLPSSSGSATRKGGPYELTLCSPSVISVSPVFSIPITDSSAALSCCCTSSSRPMVPASYAAYASWRSGIKGLCQSTGSGAWRRGGEGSGGEVLMFLLAFAKDQNVIYVCSDKNIKAVL